MAFIFPGSNFLLKKLNSAFFVGTIEKGFLNEIGKLKSIVFSIKSDNFGKEIEVNQINNDIDSINSIVDTINSYLKVVSQVDIKYKSTSAQKNMCFHLYNLKDALKQSKIIRLLLKAKMDIDQNNFVEYRGSHLDDHLNKILDIIMKIERSINKSFLFNSPFGTIQQLRVEIINKFNCEERKILVDKNIYIDSIILFSPKNKKSLFENKIIIDDEELENNKEQKILMIICCPNSVCFELFLMTDSITDYYHRNGIDVLLWNYRGYGMSNGKTNFDNIRTDLELIIYDIKYLKYNKIGVHGISIGSLSASYVAGKGLVDFCFIDRGFSSIDDIVKYKFKTYAYYMYKLLRLEKNSVTNVFNYFKATCPKILSCDYLDKVIPNEASLKTGVSNEIIGYLKSKEVLNSANKKFYLIEAILNEESELFCTVVTNLIKIINSQNDPSNINEDNSNSNQSALDNTILTLNNISQNEERMKSPRNIYSNEVMVSDENNLNSCLNEEKTILKIKQTLEKLDAGGETLISINPNSKTVKNKIDTFFSNLLIWGSYRVGKVIATDKKIIFKALIKKLNIITSKLMAIYENKFNRYSLDNLALKDNLKLLVKFLKRIEVVFSKIIFKNYEEKTKSNKAESLLDVTDDNIEDKSNNVTIVYNDDHRGEVDDADDEIHKVDSKGDIYHNLELSNFILSNNVGNLVPLSCGHNGVLTENEFDVISYYMFNSGFIK